MIPTDDASAAIHYTSLGVAMERLNRDLRLQSKGPDIPIEYSSGYLLLCTIILRIGPMDRVVNKN